MCRWVGSRVGLEMRGYAPVEPIIRASLHSSRATVRKLLEDSTCRATSVGGRGGGEEEGC